MLQRAHARQRLRCQVGRCHLAIELSLTNVGKVHEQQTIDWDDMYETVLNIINLKDKGCQGLVSGFFPQLRSVSQTITCLGALRVPGFTFFELILVLAV